MTSEKLAVLYCSGGRNCADRFVYEGVATCESAAMMYGGQKSCGSGCLGFGDCVRACRKNAMIHGNGMAGDTPAVDPKKCDGCGECIPACPKKLIALTARFKNVQVRCSSSEKSNHIKNICAKGCISCGICAKICPLKAITAQNSIAKINFEKCNFCGLCVEKCPTDTINRILTREEG